MISFRELEITTTCGPGAPRVWLPLAHLPPRPGDLLFKKGKLVIVSPFVTDLPLSIAKSNLEEGLWATRQSGMPQHHLRDWCCWCWVPLH